MESVPCNFCGCKDSNIRFRIRSQNFYPDYLNAIHLVGPHPPEEFTVVSCNECGLLFLNPRYDINELASVYPEEQYTNRVGNFSGSVLFKFMAVPSEIKNRGESIESADNLKKFEEINHYKKDGRILDVGCSSGSFLALMEIKGWDTYGVDFSRTAIDNSRNIFGQINTFCGQLAEAKYPDCYFDAVTMYNTIEHLQNPKEVLNEINRVLKNSGLLVIQTVDFDSINARFFPRSLIYPGQHLYYFRKRDLNDLLESLGYVLKDCHFESIGFKRFIFYFTMHWWAKTMVLLHRKERSRASEFLRYFLEKLCIIPDENEVLKRLKMVGATNMPIFRGVRTFFFIKKPHVV